MPNEAPALVAEEVIYRQTDFLPDGKEEDILTLRKFSNGRIDIHRYSGGSATRHVTGYYDNESLLSIEARYMEKIGEEKLRAIFSDGWIGGRDTLREMMEEGDFYYSIMSLNGS